MLPFYHIFGESFHDTDYPWFKRDDAGIVQIQLMEILRGIPVVVMPGFEPTQFCQYVERYKITHVCTVPPILLVLLHHPCEKYSPHFRYTANLPRTGSPITI